MRAAEVFGFEVVEVNPAISDDLVAPGSGDAGRPLLRLDCAAANPPLRAYYAALGFVERGVRDFPSPWKALARFEKSVS